MIHASVELVGAMRNVRPYGPIPFPPPRSELLPACGEESGPAVYAWEYDDEDVATEPRGSAVNCPACLRLMREATDPVRWDALEERGLAPKLEAA